MSEDELKPGDRVVCLAPERALDTSLPGYCGLERGVVYTVRNIPKPRYVSLVGQAPEVHWQQSRFMKR